MWLSLNGPEIDSIPSLTIGLILIRTKGQTTQQHMQNQSYLSSGALHQGLTESLKKTCSKLGIQVGLLKLDLLGA